MKSSRTMVDLRPSLQGEEGYLTGESKDKTRIRRTKERERERERECVCMYLSQRRSHGRRHFRNVFRVPGVSCGQNTVQSPLIDGIYIAGVVLVLLHRRLSLYTRVRPAKLRVSVSNASLKIINRGTWKNARNAVGTWVSGFSGNISRTNITDCCATDRTFEM